MRLKIKINTYEVDAEQNMEILANMEDFYDMLDKINPVIIDNYIKHKDQNKSLGWHR